MDKSGLHIRLGITSAAWGNCAILAALPNGANDDQPPRLTTAAGTILRSAWKQAGTNSAKSMTDEAGHRAFLLPDKVPGYEKYFPDADASTRRTFSPWTRRSTT